MSDANVPVPSLTSAGPSTVLQYFISTVVAPHAPFSISFYIHISVGGGASTYVSPLLNAIGTCGPTSTTITPPTILPVDTAGFYNIALPSNLYTMPSAFQNSNPNCPITSITFVECPPNTSPSVIALTFASQTPTETSIQIPPPDGS